MYCVYNSKNIFYYIVSLRFESYYKIVNRSTHTRIGKWYSVMKKISMILSMLITFLGIGIGMSTIHANASELNQSGIADRITFATNSMPQGGLSTFTVDFTEKKQDQIKPGDTMTMKFPAGLEGLRNKGQDYVIPLKNAQGVQFGTAVVSQGQAVVTFSDVVKNLDNIRGSFTIGFVASNVLKTTDTVFDTNLGLDVTKQRLTVPGIPVQQDQGPRQGPFTHYKVGDMLNGADEVRWFININPYEQGAFFVDPIVIKDKQGPGQKLNKDSFAISISWRNSQTGREEGQFMTIKEVVDRGWATIQFDDANNGFEVWIDVRSHPELVSGKRVSLQYTSEVTDKSATKLTNDYSIHYRRTTDNGAIDDNATASVDRVVMGGGADGDGRPLPKPPVKPEDVMQGTIDETAIIEEEVKPWEPVDPKPEDGKGTIVPDETHKADETDKPDILNNGKLIEETLTEEQLEILEEVIQEHADGHLEDGHTHVIEIDGKPQVLNDSQIIEELLTDEQVDKLKDIIEEHADMTGITDENGKATETDKPEIIEPKPEDKHKDDEKKDEVKPSDDKKQDGKKKDEVKPSDDKNQTEKKLEETKAASVKDAKNDQADKDLPETGYNSGLLISAVGLILASLGVLFYKKSR